MSRSQRGAVAVAYVRGVSALVRARGYVCARVYAGVCAVLCLELTRTMLNATIKVLYSDVKGLFSKASFAR